MLNYRPGESIWLILPSMHIQSRRPASHAESAKSEQFSNSTCKRMSGDKMSCTSCHDPHFTPSAEQRTAFYRGKCLACHSQPEFATAHHPENRDCTSCHMSRNRRGEHSPCGSGPTTVSSNCLNKNEQHSRHKRSASLSQSSRQQLPRAISPWRITRRCWKATPRSNPRPLSNYSN